MAMLAAALLAACGEDIVYSDYQAVADEGWRRADTLSFTTAVTAVSGKALDFYVDVRHGNDYPYRNLTLAVTSMLTTSEDTLTRRDTLRLMLADDKGRWTGEGAINLYHKAAYVATLRADTSATYRFFLRPAMSDSLLKGISDIGVRLSISSASRDPHQSAGTRTTKWYIPTTKSLRS